jgi:hypothetical protein
VSYEYRRGETILVALDAVKGDASAVTEVVAVLKCRPPGGSVDPDAQCAATFAVSPRAAAGGFPAGWTLSIPAEVSLCLEPGPYRADARIRVGAAIIYTEPLEIRINEPLTPPVAP